MSMYANCRGTVTIIDNGGGGAGIYKVDGLSDVEGILLDGVSPMDPGVLVKKHTLDDEKILYSFGPSFGDILVTGTLLIGLGAGEPLNALQSWYAENRVSVSLTSVNASAGGHGYKMFVTKLLMGGADAEFMIQTFELHGILASPEGG